MSDEQQQVQHQAQCEQLASQCHAAECQEADREVEPVEDAREQVERRNAALAAAAARAAAARQLKQDKAAELAAGAAAAAARSRPPRRNGARRRAGAEQVAAAAAAAAESASCRGATRHGVDVIHSIQTEASGSGTDEDGYWQVWWAQDADGHWPSTWEPKRLFYCRGTTTTPPSHYRAVLDYCRRKGKAPPDLAKYE